MAKKEISLKELANQAIALAQESRKYLNYGLTPPWVTQKPPETTEEPLPSL